MSSIRRANRRRAVNTDRQYSSRPPAAKPRTGPRATGARVPKSRVLRRNGPKVVSTRHPERFDHTSNRGGGFQSSPLHTYYMEDTIAPGSLSVICHPAEVVLTPP